jgi:hypothetical protein
MSPVVDVAGVRPVASPLKLVTAAVDGIVLDHDGAPPVVATRICPVVPAAVNDIAFDVAA